MTPAYSDGYLACRAGVPLSDNPYLATITVDVTDFWDWRRGWQKAERDIDNENEARQFREPR